MNGQGDGQATTAGAEIQRQRRGRTGPFGGVFKELPAEFRQKLGFGTGNEDIRADGEIETAKAHGTEDVLQGFALAAAAYEFAERGLLVIGEDALKVQVEFHAGDLENVGEEQFGVQAGGFHAFFGEKINAALDGLQNGHWHTIGSKPEVQRGKCDGTSFEGFP